VIQVAGNILVLDGNHPLAGQDLVFEVNIISAREACMEDFDEPFMATASDYIH
jgi:FKBP-type peptidyl-prolyl cis-trans isomerase SlyD